MINKPSIIISSLGRTGTTFFNHFFRKHFPQIESFHEPATIHYKRGNFLGDLKFNIDNFGFCNSVVKKALGKWSILNISKKRVAGKIESAEAVSRIIKERENFINKLPKDFYLESNYHFYALLDLLDQAFESYRAIYIIRDPRDWVRSYINLKGWYHFSDVNKHIGNRLAPGLFHETEIAARWRKFSQFEKLCWSWNRHNEYIKKITADLYPAKFRIFRFEDIFNRANTYRTFFELIDFICSLDEERLEASGDMRSTIGQKIHKPKKYFFPKWTEWNIDQVQMLDKYCGKTMRQYGYGKEVAWLDRVNNRNSRSV